MPWAIANAPSAAIAPNDHRLLLMVGTDAGPTVMVLIKGQQLKNGQYTIERSLRQGVFTESYLARRSDGERWVIKVFQPQHPLRLDKKEQNRKETLFWQEAIKLHRCSGTPHIARAEMPFKEGTLICLPVEYLGGDSLAERPERCLQELTALRYICQIGAALTVVHKEKLVHRDIRPANIFLRIREGQAEAVLTNFELAVDRDAELTRTRKAELTDGYSPIELYSRGKTIGSYTDVYALAATLYQLLTGVTPVSAYERKANEAILKSPRDVNSEISVGISDAIATGMALDPQDRPQSVEAWLALLHNPEKSRVRFGVIDWGKWGAIAAWVGVIVTVAGILVSIWLAFRKQEPSPEPQPTSSSQPSPKPQEQ